MPDFQHRVVITGGPGSGKSSLMNTLLARGYWCSDEAGRAIIQDQVQIGGHALPWEDRDAFAELMLSWEMRSWHVVKGHETVCFFDRGVPDIAGYLNLCNLLVPKHLSNAIQKFRYNQTVFIAPPWEEIYVQDSERKQSFEEALRTYHAMVSIYKESGYQLFELPYSSIDDRADLIISQVAKM